MHSFSGPRSVSILLVSISGHFRVSRLHEEHERRYGTVLEVPRNIWSRGTYYYCSSCAFGGITTKIIPYYGMIRNWLERFDCWVMFVLDLS